MDAFRRAADMKCGLLVTMAALQTSQGLYLPGFAPIEYQEGGPVDLKVNKMTSSKTQLPYSYYNLPYCQPSVENSPYVLNLLKNETCKVLCKRPLPEEDKEKFRGMIEDEYVVNWMVDNLPAATRYWVPKAPDGEAEKVVNYAYGFPVGFAQKGRYFVVNHVLLDIQYHSNPELYEGYRIVGFEVEPRSMDQKLTEDQSQPGGYRADCGQDRPMGPFEIDSHDAIAYTYDVRWTYSEVLWASRWDAYLKMIGGQIHWFSVLNFLMILLFLSGTGAMNLLRTLHQDITKYNEMATAEEAKEETCWIFVLGDVFRRLDYLLLLSQSVTLYGVFVELRNALC